MMKLATLLRNHINFLLELSHFNLTDHLNRGTDITNFIHICQMTGKEQQNLR